ncbi:SusC/RagA family TonB-linked outer membrane protein [Chitinophaga sp. CF418]|uniref:SusC/RagA family TonB-linked outer membrane protein n=1 Tax=Chitinophaga sp. CF418 TaxID=1855287 RepID=UPI00165EE652|nr:SusC/RagA family TonB-linked outer membrane protein [Chitinophaga sp. CF418]
MKLILILLITFQASALALAQQVTLNFKNAPITKVLRSIQMQTGYGYSMDGAEVKYAKPVTLNLKNATIEETLQSLFSNQPFNYKIDGKVIKITRKQTETAAITPVKIEKDGEVTGQVTDKDGKPLAGATVSVKDGSLGAVTDANGRFKITGAPANGTLVITMIGRETRQVNYKSNLIAPIVLLEVNAALKEVQIIAYGEVEKKFATSNIGSVSGEVISRQPVTNALMALQGRTPGLFIQQSSGLSTGSINVTVQGKNSISSGNTPFYVIDGVPYTPNSIRSLNVGVLLGPTSNLNFISPSDIESITILKDADATAIYGSRAANGAILITTKKGKPGQTKVNLNMQTGWSKVAKKQKLLNSAEYLEMRREAFRNNDNATPDVIDYDVNGAWDLNRDNDWQKELIGGTAQFQNLQASISGGTDRTQFLVGAGYIRETTVFSGDFSNIRGTVNFNINNISPNGKFRYFISGNYLSGLNRLPQADLTTNAVMLAPNAPKLYNPDGTVNWDIDPVDNITSRFWDNPVSGLLQTYRDKSNNLVANSNLSYELLPGLALKSSFGYNRLENNELATIPKIAVSPDQRPFFNGNGKYGNKSVTTWIIEPQLTFYKSYSFGTIDGIIGSTFQNTDNYVLMQEGMNYNSDAQLPDLNAAGTKTIINSTQAKYKYSAIFGRLSYRYKDRYILNFSARRDGSSRFGSENLFHNFYSVGGAWIFSEEDLFKKLLPLANFGKLRATYGTTGNDQIGDYSFYSLYGNYSVPVPYQGVVGLNPRGLANPFLQWEETRKLNFGVDLGFFDSRIMIRADYFRNRSSNQLLGKNLSLVTGFNGIRRNLPALVQNTGWEFTLDYTPVKGSNFTWSGSANITIPQNKLIRYDGLAESSDNNRFIIGESIGIVKVFQYEGVNPITGLYEFVTVKGELTSAPVDPTDKIRFLNLDPKWYGGFSNTVSFKGFDLDMFFQFSKQKAAIARFGNYPGANIGQQPKIVLNRWRKAGDVAEIQKVTTNFAEYFDPLNAAGSSDAAYGDATYVRLKNVSLSYRFNAGFIKKAHISNARIFVQGQNLLTITNYFGGVDPETQSAGSLGALRTFTIGTQLTF